jgi:nicotinamidase/pyrazinamidase
MRAGDRVAIWHTAADDPPPMDVGGNPPSGLGDPYEEPTPAPVEVFIPKSKKFNTPANALKNVLKNHPAPQASTPHSSQALNDWMDKHPYFTQAYLKPKYSEALKTKLGNDDYEKLLHHLSPAHHEQLTGKKSEGTPAKSTKQIAEETIGQVPGIKPMTQEEFFGPGGPAAPGLGPKKPVKKAPTKAPAKQPTFGEKFKQVMPSFDADKLNTMFENKPGDAKAVLEQMIQQHKGSPAGKALQKIHDEHFAEEPPEPTDEDEIAGIKQMVPPPGKGKPAITTPGGLQPGIQHPALAQSIKKLLPNSPGDWDSMDDAQIKGHLENMLKYLPETPGYEQHIPQLQAVYDKFFPAKGAAPAAPPEEEWEQQLLPQPQAPAPSSEDQAFQAWFAQTQGLTEEQAKKEFAKMGPQGVANWSPGGTYYEQYGPGGGKQQEPEAQPQAEGPEGGADNPGFQSWLANSHNMYGGHIEDMKAHNPELLQDYLDAYWQMYGPQAEPEPADLGHGEEAYSYPGASFANITQKHFDEIPSKITEGTKGNYTLTPGFAAFAESKGYGLDELAKLPYNTAVSFGQKPSVVGLANEFNTLDPDQQAIYAEQEGQGQAGGAQPGGFDKQQLANDLADIWGVGPSNPFIKDVLEASTPEAAKKVVEKKYQDWHGDGTEEPTTTAGKIKAILDKHFGGEAPTEGQPFDKDAFFKDYAEAYGSDSPTEMGFYAQNYMKSPEQIAAAIKQKADDFQGTSKGTKLQAIYDKHFGGGAQQAPVPFDGDQLAKDFYAIYKGEGDFSENGWYQIFASGPQQAKDKLDSLATGPFSKKAKDAATAMLAKYFSGGMPKLVPKGPPQPAFVPPNPTFDWSAFGPEFKEVFPKSEWASGSDPGAQAAEQKLQGQLEQSLSNAEWAKSPKTQQIKDFYQKWFPQQYAAFMAGQQGAGAPTPAAGMPKYTPEQLYNKVLSASDPALNTPQFQQWFMEQNSTLQHFYAGNPEAAAVAWEEENLPPPPPPKPFKSETPNPDDIAQWAANKPQSEAGWKNFATWWGNNKLTPEQETGLFKAWTGKDVAPEQANAWFAAQFEQQSEPSEGDLGLTQGVPAWATAHWAFGKKADTEWPVFQAWATKHPGFPQGTTIKQKVAIWNGLSAQDKKDFAEQYFPKGGVDTKAVVDALKAAWPGHDFSKWEGMSPQVLKKNMENLANVYPEAIPIFNEYFGGTMQAPSEAEGAAPPPKQFTAEETAQALQQLYPGTHVAPASMKQMGNLLQNETDPAKKQALAEIIGASPAASGTTSLAESLKKIYPTTDWDKTLQTKSKAQVTTLLKKQLKTETDPAKFAMLASVWQAYFPHPDKSWDVAPTGIKELTQFFIKYKSPGAHLGSEELKALAQYKAGDSSYIKHPAHAKDYDAGPVIENWKGEGGQGTEVPLPFYGWTPPSGTAAAKLAPELYGTIPGAASYQVPPEAPKSKAYTELMTRATKWEPPPFKAGDFQTDYKKVFPNGKAFKEAFPKWDWHHSVLGQGAPTYQQARQEINYMLKEPLQYWQHQKLEQLWDKWFRQPEFGPHDKAVLNSSAFQNWFAKAPKDYQEVAKLSPGRAIDDYEDFMGGGPTYTPVPQGEGKKIEYPVTPYSMLPWTKPGKPHEIYLGPGATEPYIKGYDPSKTYESEHDDPEASKWPGFSKNPMRSDTARQTVVKTPVKPPPSTGQLEIPLPAGETFSPTGTPVELHRWTGIKIQPGTAWTDQHPPVAPKESLKTTNPKAYAKEEHKYQRDLHLKWLLDQIRYRFYGSEKAEQAVPDLFSTHEEEGGEGGFTKVPEEWKTKAPVGVEGIFDFNKWAQANNVPPEQVYQLAKKWGVDDPAKYGTPPISEGPWTAGMDPNVPSMGDPGFSRLILDYLEATDYYKPGWGYAPPGSLGDHWSIANTGGKGFSSGDLNVLQTGDWFGQGENPPTAHAVVGFGSQTSGEREINLAQGAPLWLKRLRILAPGTEWTEGITGHDLAIDPHWRYASIPHTAAVDVPPENLYHLAVLWEIPHPERYGYTGPQPLGFSNEPLTEDEPELVHLSRVIELDEAFDQMTAALKTADAPRRRALVVVDPQNDFIHGSLPVPEGERIAYRLHDLMTDPHNGYDHVVTTQDWHIDPGDHWSDNPDFVDSWPRHGEANTWGAELHDALKDDPVDERFYKGQYSPGYSGFEGHSQTGTALGDWLQQNGVGHVDVAGLATDKCVYNTAKDAHGLGLHTRVLPHYSSPVTPEGGRAALEDLQNRGVEIVHGPHPAIPQMPGPEPMDSPAERAAPPKLAVRRPQGILTHTAMRR